MDREYKTIATTGGKHREYVIGFIKEKSLVTVEDNLILSEKAFVVNAMLKWCYECVSQKKMNSTLWGKCKKMIAQYIAGTVEIEWDNNKFTAIEVKADDKPKKKSRPRKPNHPRRPNPSKQ